MQKCQPEQLHLAPLILTIHLFLYLKPLYSTYDTLSVYDNRTMIPQNLSTTKGNTVNECERSKQSERQANTQAQGLVEWDHRVSWDTNSRSPSVTQFSYHHLFSLNSKTLSVMLCVKIGHLPASKKLSGCYVQMKCSSTAKPSVCLQNSHRIHRL